jgi:hypothetical protein
LTDNSAAILKTFMRRLTGLSGSSRVLFLLRLNRSQLLDLQELSQLNGQPAFSIIQSLIAGREKVICPVLNSRMEAVNQASSQLKTIHRQDRFIYEERGSSDLHVGWPVLRGKFSDGTPVRAPLLFFPVLLVQENEHWVMRPRKNAGITFNKSLLLAYYFYNQLPPDDDLLEEDFELFDTDSTVFRTQLYELLNGRLEINFNPETFTDSLKPFQVFTKDEFEQQYRTGELKLFPEALLGIFPQAVSQLLPDYAEALAAGTFTSVEDFFATKNTSELNVDAQAPVAVNLAVREEDVLTPFALDAWQEHALKLVRLGQSLVVQGPPGTGKSQLISNLIADGIANGKRILLVCQKRVALDVVYERLQQNDLNDFVGLVHDFRDDRKAIFQQIARQIERLDEYRRMNRSIDAIQTERRFVQISRTIDRNTEQLEEFRQALYDDQECGLSAKELYLTSQPDDPAINIKQEYQHFHFSSVSDFVRKLSFYVRYASQFDVDDYAWRERKSFAGYTREQAIDMQQLLTGLPAYQDSLAEKIYHLVALEMNLEACADLLQRKEVADEMVSLLADETVFRYFQAMTEENDDETSLLWVQNMERLVLNCFDEDGLEKSLRIDQVGTCQVALRERLKARKNLIRRIRWEFFSEHHFFLKRVLISNALPYTKKGLRALEARLDNRLNYEHHVTALRSKAWLIDFPDDYDPRNIKRWFEKQKYAIRAKVLFSELREIKPGIHPVDFTRDDFIRLIWSVFDTLAPLAGQQLIWQQYFSPIQLRTFIHHPYRAALWREQLQRDFDSLCEFDNLKDSLHPHEREIIVRLYDLVGRWDEAEIIRKFQNSLRLAWIDHIETKNPVLRSVTTLQFESLQKELQDMVAEKLELSKAIILLRARESICESIAYNRLNNRITYRDLQHQVTKRKRLWPVRKLITTYHEELFNLIPCWMASPESVSALFPLQQLFDLVIFDEASQCFAERGLPAMIRGKQVVIAGDDKQLRPFELYQVRWEEESDLPDLEVDSLLEFSSRYLNTVHLCGHYRSKALELIEFSNQNFYGGNLRALPDKSMLDRQEAAIEYHKLDGIWEDQANEEEAGKVVEIVAGYLNQSSAMELGVVTFNMPQQLMIMDKLETYARESGTVLPPSLFVKNIENVQGDERDVIIFSVGYAPDKHGRLAMQFGSLNVAGGENRLNVAITRAREKVIIVSSIWPEDLRTDDVKNEGPRLLKSYLAFARNIAKGEFTPELPAGKSHHPDWYLNTQLSHYEWPSSMDCRIVASSLPFADLQVQQEAIPEGIVLTDDNLYHQAITVKESHVYLPALLSLKHWKNIRVFSRNWWSDREETVQNIARFIYQLKN